MFDFKIHSTEGAARRGKFSTPHGEVQTPAFMPVGTLGTVKGLIMDEVSALGAEMVLANTYHLYLRPGHELVHDLGGLHEFCLLYTSPSPRDRSLSRMPSSA